MHNIILKFFGFLKSCIQFIKILIVFTILMLLFYWVQNLLHTEWSWLNFIDGFLDFITDVGANIMPGSIDFFGSVLEFKYLMALVLLGIIYLVIHLVYIMINNVEDAYCTGRKLVKKIEEDMFNKHMENQMKSEEKKIKQYQIYISTEPKKELENRNFHINIEEQNQILLKHLVKQTSQCPEKYKDGYLFTFDNFEQIDKITDIFIKLHQSKAPINYFICVQIMSKNRKKEIEQLDYMIKLQVINKIIMLADTQYRYQYNTVQNYNTLQLGVFQNGVDTYEVHYFVNKE